VAQGVAPAFEPQYYKKNLSDFGTYQVWNFGLGIPNEFYHELYEITTILPFLASKVPIP
jgi:hypothetical protein